MPDGVPAYEICTLIPEFVKLLAQAGKRPGSSAEGPGRGPSTAQIVCSPRDSETLCFKSTIGVKLNTLYQAGASLLL